MVLKVATVLALLFVGMLVFDFGLNLMNKPSNESVLGGVAILVAVVAVALVVGYRVFKLIDGKVKHTSISRNRFSMIAVIFLAVGSMALNTGCSRVIPPGHVGIQVNQSGSDRGVQDFPLQTGRVFYNPITETVFEYPTSVQRVIWTVDRNEGNPINEEISYNSKDELVFTGDFTCSYELVREKVPAFYVRFRNDDIAAFTHGFFRDQVRDALNEIAVSYTADELYGEKKSEFLEKALGRVRDRVAAFGVNVISLGYASSPRPPEQVANAINAKIAAIQKASQTENELRQSEAEAKKVVAAAEGTAKANDMISKSINAQLVSWRQLDVQQQAINKWNGQLPYYSGGGAIPFIQMQK